MDSTTIQYAVLGVLLLSIVGVVLWVFKEHILRWLEDYGFLSHRAHTPQRTQQAKPVPVQRTGEYLPPREKPPTLKEGDAGVDRSFAVRDAGLLSTEPVIERAFSPSAWRKEASPGAFVGVAPHEPIGVPTPPPSSPEGAAEVFQELKGIYVRMERDVRLLREALERAGIDLAGGEVGRNLSRSGFPVEPPIQAFTRLYNAGVEDPPRQSEFRARYKPTLMGTANIMERRKDVSADPEFQARSDGEYYAVELQDSGRTYTAVVPKFDLTFQESSYGPGAMGWVFECPNYDRHLRYRRVKVERPALFDHSGQSWTLRQQGKLDLGQGES